ncbi:cbb3-type cytochrome c oxidase subunit I [Agrobacterium vitis]|uniref:hypothetical protein n=1 Tax=Rhizobium/Agrobacterium group TaxID=227290 RepID=UPI000872F7E0|nr:MULTISPECIES: hypothetical protein [Rhizobium/Agrobacterium group]MCF1449311.1 cbb3-type cytochrome c oxidase subunit I [Allorhizobium ampelinum]MCF1464172.1 cbb3-type cytochrome c oxidase subunit I [Allorhizobium ampelinum]MCF1484845.1 cbb3-type cytochrome c oxidase subunit I [Allorhizobium ampelinum]MUO71973.1 hypothetical protein [Agrobacterium vitis]
MPGATLSRWTMSYFAAALAFLVVGEGMMVLGFGYPAVDIAAPQTLVIVHTVVIGWLGLLMSGALLQFVPVLVARPLWGARLAFPALAAIIVGLLCLLSGFIALGGDAGWAIYDLPAGAGLLALGFGLLIGIFAVTLLQARPLPLPARFVAVGLMSLAGTVALGVCFALTLSGLGHADHATALLVNGVSLHAILGLGGWMTFTAMGVSYRLLAMFMLSPENERASQRVVWWAGAAALALVAGAVPVVIALDAGVPGMLLAAATLGLLATAVYAADVVRLYRQRKRRLMELNSRVSLGAFTALFATIAIAVLVATSGRGDESVAALAYVTVFGWLTGLGLAQLYKIVPFLTWLECYGPVLGRLPTPRVQDLVDERKAMRWFLLFFAAVALATLALLAQQPALFRLAAFSQLVATVFLVLEFVRARRLAHVSITLQLPGGAVRPNLFLPQLPTRRSP